MADKKNIEPDIFAANKCYPDAGGLFYGGFQTLEQVRDTCLVVLDTNALLVPYGVSKNGLAEIASTYRPLAENKRLIIPGQVAREFAKNRPLKIGEIFQAISRKRNLQSPEKRRYPLLEDASTYQKLIDLEDQIADLITKYQKSVGELLHYIRDWNWNDPVSNLYSELFQGAILDPTLNEAATQTQLEYSQTNKIPPGYKDSSKLDQGVGDLLVWQAAVQAASDYKLPVVLVSGDSKADWFYRSEGQALFPRYELVDEIRRVSDGKSLHIVSFSQFLELFGATAEAIGEVRKEEIKIDLSTMTSFGRNSVLAHLAEQSVSDWLEQKYPHLAISRDDRYGSYALSEPNGATILVSVKYFAAGRHPGMIYARIRESLSRIEEKLYSSDYDNILVFLVFELEEAANETAQRLPDIVARIGQPKAGIVVSYLPKDGSLCVQDPFGALPNFE